MKSIKFLALLIISIISTINIQAQQIADGLRYSMTNIAGTARFSGMSGAMGALGGDLSAMETNPAGSAIFLDSYSTFSVRHKNNVNNSTYYGQGEDAATNRFNINQAGGVFVFHNNNENSNFRKLSLGFNYSLQKDFSNEIFLAGRGNTSITEFFLAQAQGIPLDLLNLQSEETISDLYRYLGENYGTAAQNAFLGYQAYLFDPLNPDDPRNSEYSSNVRGNKFNQKYQNLTNGNSVRFTINLGTQVSESLFLGANINTYGFDYRQRDTFLESNNHSGSFVNRIGFENSLTTYGSGISLQFGAIAKFSNNLRLGLSLDTPTWYQVSEETTQYLESRRFENGENKTAVINPNVINIYEDYTLRTPGKATVSVAYIFNQNGLLSIDYSYKGYSSIRFSPSSDSYFKDLNSEIDNTLKGASLIRTGGEYRLNRFSFRGGFHYEETPYKKDDILGDMIGFSLGAGVNFGHFNLDLSFMHSERTGEIQMYPVGLTDRADVKGKYNNFILSLAYSL